MIRHEVYKMLKKHHKNTGCVTTPAQMMLAAGEETERAAIIDAVHMFSRYLDQQRGRTA
ncbi:hypothetical protein RG959_15330 [Domibacillus sp. 8LH]|uniref:hypothetical protein n=1 Tax=Domibacillus sp. 8LH TaxID=3073900 RepID=UPI003179EFBA